nr:cellulose biosynthesis cyclic di-GMP-binding regulatory protein BcsB [Methylogaea oryzae]
MLSHALFSGESTTVRQVEYPPRRRPYDAPNWLPTDRPVKFGELVDDAAKLQVEGYAPAPIQINLRMPPDLWDGQSQGARLDLKYRYTPPAQLDGSTLDVSLNNRFVHAFRLKPDGAEIENGRFAIPLWEQSGGTRKQASLSPKFQMGGKNRLQFRFIFDDKQSGGDHCSGRPLSNVHGALDADSTIDLTNMPHYTAMPNLGLFVNNGFPFTKYADLAETTIALPERPTSVDMETFLALMGHMGKFTGIPALAFNLLTTDKIADAGDSDILVINASSSQDLLTRWEDHFPAVVGPNRRNIPVGAMSSMRALLDPDADRQAENGSAILDGEGPMAALVSFQSPLESGRTVVALMGTESDMAETIIQAMEDEGQASRINKNVVFIRSW